MSTTLNTESNETARQELDQLRNELRTLVAEASYAKGIKVVRASKIAALLDEVPANG